LRHFKNSYRAFWLETQPLYAIPVEMKGYFLRTTSPILGVWRPM